MLTGDLNDVEAGAEHGSFRQDNGLTERELEIVRLVASGYKNKEVSETLRISERTVKTHLTNYSGARNRYPCANGTEPA